MDSVGAIYGSLYAQTRPFLLFRNSLNRFSFPTVLEVMVALRVYLLEGRPPYATGYVIFSVWCARRILIPPNE